MDWRDQEDHYRTLGLAPTATAQDVREAYRKMMASRFHPDNGGDPNGWGRFQRAYNTLIDDNARAQYDAIWFEPTYGDEDCDDTLVDEAGDEDPWHVALEEFDLHAALGVSASGSDGDGISGGRPCRRRNVVESRQHA